MIKMWQSYGWLYQKYIQENLPPKIIARQDGASEERVVNLLNNYGITRHGNKNKV